jgi:hypothetical protein
MIEVAFLAYAGKKLGEYLAKYPTTSKVRLFPGSSPSRLCSLDVPFAIYIAGFVKCQPL